MQRADSSAGSSEPDSTAAPTSTPTSCGSVKRDETVTSSKPSGEGEDGGTYVPELNDDALLEVFRMLPYWALLRGPRGVCRRWRRVALDPCLWKKLTLTVDAETKPAHDKRVTTVLRIAPCLRSLSLHAVLGDGLNWSLRDALVKGRCIPSEIRFDIEDYPWYHGSERRSALGIMGGELLPIFQRHMKSEKLQKVALVSMPADLATRLVLGALDYGRFSRLDVSILDIVDDDDEPFVAASPPTGLYRCRSLSVLRILKGGHHPLLADVVKVHFEVLTSVTVLGPGGGLAVDRLGKCLKLQAAHVPAVPAALKLTACPLLTTLSLTFHNPVPDLRPLFRQAAQLRKLFLLIPKDHPLQQKRPCFAKDEEHEEEWVAENFIPDDELDYFYPRDYEAWDNDYELDGCRRRIRDAEFAPHDVHSVDVVGLLSEMGLPKQPKRPELRQLTLGRFHLLRRPRQQRALWSTLLSGFPQLQEVYVSNVPPPDALDSITPSSAPHLRVISFKRVCWQEVTCLQAECCYPALFRLVQRNRNLHVINVPAVHDCYDEADSDYDECDETPCLANRNTFMCHLFGHDEGDHCTVAGHDRPIRFCGPRCTPSIHWHFVGAADGGRCSLFCYDRSWFEWAKNHPVEPEAEPLCAPSADPAEN